MPRDDVNMPALLSHYSIILLKCYDRMGRFEDLEHAILTIRRAIDMAPAGATEPDFLTNFGNALARRFELTGELGNIEEAISAHRRALEVTDESHPAKASRLANLGVSLLRRFERTDRLDDLEKAVAAHRLAVELTPVNHPDRASRLSILGGSLLRSFERAGRLGDLETAIAAQREAVELTEDSRPDKASRLTNLGGSLMRRFQHTGEMKNLHDAVEAHRCAVDFTPDDHPNKPLLFANYANALCTRYERTGAIHDLAIGIDAYRRAVESTSEGHPNRPTLFRDFGNALLQRFKHNNERVDLEDGIVALRHAVEHTLEGHPSRPFQLNSLGNSLCERFERTGEMKDLEDGISMHHEAVELTPDGHPDKPKLFNNLGNSLRRRFDRIGDIQDLEGAIVAHRHAVKGTPESHSEKALWYHNLGNVLTRRFEHTGDLEDLEEPISTYRHALQIMFNDDAHRPAILSQLCDLLRKRYERTGDPDDIEAAISAVQLALDLAGDGPNQEVRMLRGGLAGCLQRRSERTENLDDLTTAITMLQDIVDHTPDIDPFRIACFENLAGAQQQLFERTQAQDNFDAAVLSYMSATMQPFGNPSQRLKSAMRCVSLLEAHPTFRTVESLLSAHSRIIDILPEVVWLGHSIHRRYDESSKLAKLINAAVAAAIDAGELQQAVQWLEAGRSLIWSQLLSLRTPLDELKDSQPSLAASFQKVQQQLQLSIHGTFVPDSDAVGGVAGISVNTAADHHRRLAIDHEDLLKSIRECPGFHDFLRPKRLAALIPSPGVLGGPVVFINVHLSRCDALVLAPSGEITSVALPHFSYEQAKGLLLLWINQLVERMGRERGLVSAEALRGYLNPFTIVLQRLWQWVVCPVLEALDLATLIKDDRIPHITWCPTGLLAYLPLHAAGIYGDQFGPRVHDFVVSSYTPSLAALISGRDGVAQNTSKTKLLLVTQPATPGLSPLPGTASESFRLFKALRESRIESTVLDDKHATVQTVREAVAHHHWVHLACHGSQDFMGDPTKSAFLLYDGPLSLATLMGTVAKDAELAFLSACQTAVGQLRNPEESAHLAAGMLAVGFKAVIATTWSIRDDDAPVVVETFYRELLALRGAGVLSKGETGVAYALHEATRVLREKVGDNNFMRWVPFVHFGV
ncbi:TPR-like protein [Peniophora sp. CONT]|nr:TPR-like protein [Peniophora sp. CONT]